jgi:hypothetical protein
LVGVGLAVLTGADILMGGLVGALVGYLIGENGGIHANDVNLRPGTVMGVRFDQTARFDIVD